MVTVRIPDSALPTIIEAARELNQYNSSTRLAADKAKTLIKTELNH
jgi:hypothetical protein